MSTTNVSPVRGEPVVMLHVFVHSSARTGEPLEVEVFDIDGRVNMQWFHDVFDEKNNNGELAQQFFEHMGRLDDAGWFEVRPQWETACEPPGAYVEVLRLLST